MTDKIWGKISLLLPHKLVYWAAIRLAVHATTGKYSNTITPELSMMDAIKRWNEKDAPFGITAR